MKPGQAKLIRARSDIVFQLHYTANGKASADLPKLGLIFAPQRPAERVQTVAAQNEDFEIPAGAANFRLGATYKLERDATLVNLFPHMHLRGKSFEYHIVYPTGETETVLTVPRYDFNWQLTYDLAKPREVPKGTVIEVTAWYDNSPSNPVNPDPSAVVHQGVLIGFFDIAYPLAPAASQQAQLQLSYPAH